MGLSQVSDDTVFLLMCLIVELLTDLNMLSGSEMQLILHLVIWFNETNIENISLIIHLLDLSLECRE